MPKTVRVRGAEFAPLSVLWTYASARDLAPRRRPRWSGQRLTE